jgi:peptide/nickel transport system substrate-binding protein
VTDKQIDPHVLRVMDWFEMQGVSRRDFLRIVAGTAGVAAAAPLLAACGPTPQPVVQPSAPPAAAATAVPQPTQAPAPTATQAAAAQPQILIRAANQDISNLDPCTGHDYSIGSAQKSVYDALFQYRKYPPELMNVLAESHEVTPDATEWTFKLDQRAVFHDGSPVNADAVVYSFNRLLRKQQGVAWIFLNVMDETSATAVDEHTVKIKLLKPFAPFAAVLPWMFVLNPAVAKEHDVDGDEGEAWLKENEAGSGPFTIKRWEIGTLYEFEAVPDYWMGWLPQGHIDGYIWKIMRESTSKKIALEKKEIDWADWMSAEDINALKEVPGMVSEDRPQFGTFMVKMNNQVGHTSDIHVRKAISYAFDYDAVLEAMQGRADLLNGPLSDPCPGFAEGLPIYRLDMDKAKAELAQSQWPDGGFEIEYVYVTGVTIEEQVGLILLDQLSKLGITVNINPMLWPDMKARFADQDTSPELAAVYSGSDYADADNFLYAQYHSSQAGTWSAASHYKNAQVDAWLDEARSIVDETQRDAIYRQIQEKLLEDCVEIWVHSEKSNHIWLDYVKREFCPIMSAWHWPLYMEGKPSA